MSEQQTILHKAEEYGQTRAYTVDEVKALAAVVLLCGLWGAISLVVVAFGCWLVKQWGWAMLLLLALPAGFIIAGGVVLLKGVNEQLDGLRSYRKAQSFAPPLPKPPQAQPHPPIKVYPPGQKEPYLLGEPDKPALPGRETLRLTPPVIAEILEGVVENFGGSWSRRKLTRLRVAGGQKVSRSVYEQLTALLHRAGVLQQTAQGGFELLAEDLDALRDVFPDLPTSGRAGGEVGDRAGGGDPHTGSMNRVETLAERRRLAYLNRFDHSVKSYLERKRGDDV